MERSQAKGSVSIDMSVVFYLKGNACRSLNLACEGWFGNAMKALGCHGCARDDADALQELQSRHPQHAQPQWSDDIPSSLVIDCKQLYWFWKVFLEELAQAILSFVLNFFQMP